MKNRPKAMMFVVAAVVAAAAALAPGRALAQAPPVMPGGEFSLSVGYFQPSGGGWSTASQYTTLDPADFDGAVWGAAFATHLTSHIDLQFTGQYYSASQDVSYLNFVDASGYPFTQTHTISQVPMEVSLRFLPVPRLAGGGPHGGSVLRPVIPYFGGGIGAVWWDYTAEGWFVDNLVYPDLAWYEVRSTSGVSPSAHVLAGLEIQCSPWVAVWFEGRYRWASAQMGDLLGYGSQDVDLGGWALSFGTSFRF